MRNEQKYVSLRPKNQRTVYSLNDIERIVLHGAPITISEADSHRVEASYRFLEEFARDKVIYGINTGFGPMAQYRIDDADLQALQYNIIRSHSSGAGQPFAEVYVRAAMLARLCTFTQGKSGVHPSTVKLIAELINKQIYPYIPEHGSVGASGDLVQLAHMALVLIGEGQVLHQGQAKCTAEVFKAEGITPIVPHVRDGLSLVNGTAMMTGVGLVNLLHARRLLHFALLASVMVNEVVESYDDFMSEPINDSKRHTGQRDVAAAMRKLASGGNRMRKREVEMYHRHSEQVFDHKVQPYYSLRCTPQVLGPVLDTLRYAEQVLLNELHSADDNPIVDPETRSVYHGGNFHGDYVSLEMDKMRIALTRLTMLMERQSNYLYNSAINGILPPFLNMAKLGLNYGMQAMQFTQTSTTAECQTLSNSMYVHSIPCNNDNQDIVSMGTNSALLTRRVVDNAYQVMAIHLIALAQATDCLAIASKLAPSTKKIYEQIRQIAPVIVQDTPHYQQIAAVEQYLRSSNIDFELWNTPL